LSVDPNGVRSRIKTAPDGSATATTPPSPPAARRPTRAGPSSTARCWPQRQRSPCLRAGTSCWSPTGSATRRCTSSSGRCWISSGSA